MEKRLERGIVKGFVGQAQEFGSFFYGKSQLTLCGAPFQVNSLVYGFHNL